MKDRDYRPQQLPDHIVQAIIEQRKSNAAGIHGRKRPNRAGKRHNYMSQERRDNHGE